MTESDAAMPAKELVSLTDTVDLYATATSVTWRMSTDLASPVAGLRSLLMQSLHPLAMAGVDQHSGWRRDPALLLWAHGALVDSVLAAGSLMGTALSAADSNRYVAEMVTVAELSGVPRHLVPSSVPELDLYIASVRPTLRCTPAAAESMACLLDPPGLDEDTAAIWQDVRDAAIAVLPRWARQMYGYGTPRPLTPGRLAGIRQSLGVLDAMLLGQPGVLEARQQGSPPAR
jgi:uncharacterized protein (DUF2236 family)